MRYPSLAPCQHTNGNYTAFQTRTFYHGEQLQFYLESLQLGIFLSWKIGELGDNETFLDFFERKLAAIAAFIATILRISGPDRDIFFIKEAFCLSLASNRDLFELEDASESSVVAKCYLAFLPLHRAIASTVTK